MNFPRLNLLKTLIITLSLLPTPTFQKRKRKLVEDFDEKTLNLTNLETKDKDPRKLVKEYLSEIFENENQKISRVLLRDLICKNYTKKSYQEIQNFAFKNQKKKNLDHFKNVKRRYMEFYRDIDVFMMRLKSVSFGYKEVYDIFLNKKYNLFYREWHAEDIEKLFYENLHLNGLETGFVSQDL